MRLVVRSLGCNSVTIYHGSSVVSIVDLIGIVGNDYMTTESLHLSQDQGLLVSWAVLRRSLSQISA